MYNGKKRKIDNNETYIDNDDCEQQCSIINLFCLYTDHHFLSSNIRFEYFSEDSPMNAMPRESLYIQMRARHV
jgi:hypothetical protein